MVWNDTDTKSVQQQEPLLLGTEPNNLYISAQQLLKRIIFKQGTP